MIGHDIKRDNALSMDEAHKGIRYINTAVLSFRHVCYCADIARLSWQCADGLPQVLCFAGVLISTFQSSIKHNVTTAFKLVKI